MQLVGIAVHDRVVHKAHRRRSLDFICTVRTVCVVRKDRVFAPRTVCVEARVARVVIV